jgi:hypothetical protein
MRHAPCAMRHQPEAAAGGRAGSELFLPPRPNEVRESGGSPAQPGGGHGPIHLSRVLSAVAKCPLLLRPFGRRHLPQQSDPSGPPEGRRQARASGERRLRAKDRRPVLSLPPGAKRRWGESGEAGRGARSDPPLTRPQRRRQVPPPSPAFRPETPPPTVGPFGSSRGEETGMTPRHPPTSSPSAPPGIGDRARYEKMTAGVT